MEETWRWFGPDDPTRLAHIRQTGARGIVTSLHHVKYGEVWSVDEIQRRIAEIGADASLGLEWRVVESLQIPEAVKLGEGDEILSGSVSVRAYVTTSPTCTLVVVESGGTFVSLVAKSALASIR